MSLFYCKKCVITHDDCGPWDDASDIFKNVLEVHKNHVGFQAGEPHNIETETTKYINDNIDQWLHNLIAYYKPDKVCLLKDKWRHVNTP
jgi:hypothetical protein